MARFFKWFVGVVIVVSVLVPSLISNDVAVAAAPLKKSDFASHWAKNEIEWAIQKHLMWKYADGTFRPDEQLTQAQFLASLVALEGLKESTTYAPLANSWAKDIYGKVAKADWITPDIKIDPNARITRYEAAAWVTNAWGQKTYDPIEYTLTNLLVTSSYKFNQGIYNADKSKLAYDDPRYVRRTALPTDKFTRAELAHSLKMISIRKSNIAEGLQWIQQIQNTFVVKNGVVSGKIPNLPDVPFVKQIGVAYADGSPNQPSKPLRSGKSFTVQAKGKIGISGSFNSTSTFNYYWELPSLKLVNRRELLFAQDKIWNNRNK